MDGLARSVGDGIGGLIGGAIGAIGSAVSGIGTALSTALPAGALPVLGIGAAILLLWLVLKR
jgi:phage-related protein